MHTSDALKKARKLATELAVETQCDAADLQTIIYSMLVNDCSESQIRERFKRTFKDVTVHGAKGRQTMTEVLLGWEDKAREDVHAEIAEKARQEGWDAAKDVARLGLLN